MSSMSSSVSAVWQAASAAGVAASVPGTPSDVVARIERLPMSRWHIKVRAIVGIATFFDGFDALMIAYVLPILVPQWHLTGQQIGLMVSAGFFGQMLATLCFGVLAERYGRIRVLAASTAIFGFMSCLCAFAWDYNSLLIFRTIQSFGIGAEVPIAMTYIAELSRAQNRGRFVVLYELAFPIGLVCSVLVGWFVVPILGWRWLFVIGGLPAMVIAAMQLRMPESPRWLAARGRSRDADASMSTIETSVRSSTGRELDRPVPLPATEARRASWSDLFGPTYLPRTLSIWALWFGVYLLNYSMATWLPSLYRGLFNFSVSDAIGYSLVTSAVGLAGTAVCVFIFDYLPRRTVFCAALVCAALPLIWLGYNGITSAHLLLGMATVSYFFVSILSMGTFVYTPEIYSNRVRAFGMTGASFWGKVASVLGPILIGTMMGSADGVAPAFLIFGGVALVVAVICAVSVLETRNRTFEEISP